MKLGIAAKLSLLLAVVGVLAAGLTGFYAYDVSRDLLVSSAKDELLTSARVLARRITLLREEISRNLVFLARHPATLTALQDLAGSLAERDRLATLFRLLMETKPEYFQVRLIAAGDHGIERVRVDRDGDRLVRVDGEGLQEKGHYPYVFDTLKLAPGTTYLSRIVINHERGAHSGLEQPTALLATPVSDPVRGTTLGVIVINVDLDRAFAMLADDLPEGYQLFLANAQGDFLVHPDKSQTFGFDKGRRVLVQNEFPETRKLVERVSDHVLFEARDGRYAAAPVVAAFTGQPVKVSSDERLLIFGLAQPLGMVLAEADSLADTTLKIVLGLCLACVVVAVLVGRAVTRPINSMSRAVQSFAEGHQVDGLPLERSDEIGVLARSFHCMRSQILQQLTELHERREELEHLAKHDSLTGLPNRLLFIDRMEQALSAVRRDNTRLALMFIDVDKFKPINDNLGHGVGDSLLKEVAARIRAAVRESDIPARIGGDEFVVLLRTIQCGEDALTVAEKIRQEFRAPIVVQDHVIAVSVSIGVAVYPEDGKDIRALSHHADTAMYRAKESGRDAVALYS